MSTFTVLFDACIFVPAHLRNLILWMTQSGWFRAKWSSQIDQEWIRNAVRILTKKGIDELLATTSLKKTQKDMHRAVPNAKVIGFKKIAPTLKGINSKDRHVLAAAIIAKAELIVTYNLKDFPENYLSDFGIKAIHPDEFLSDLADLDCDKCLHLTKQARTHFKNPSISADEYLVILSKLRLNEFVDFLKNNKHLI